MGAALLAAVTPTLYEPALVSKGDVTLRVVDALAPGFKTSDGLEKLAVHPAGTLTCKLKVALAQFKSLFLVVTVYLTELPEGTAAGCEGVIVTVGFVTMHWAGCDEKLTSTELPALPTEMGVMVIPAAVSWKLRPVGKAGSAQEDVSGVMSNT